MTTTPTAATERLAAMPAQGVVYQLRDSVFRVRISDPAIAAYVDQLCHQFLTPPGASGLPSRELTVRRVPAEGWDILEDRARAVHRRTEIGAARHVEWRLVGTAARAERRLVHWHAAALTSDERTLLIAGAPRSGKSTLALALVAAGWELAGEDIVFMEPDSGRLHPFRRAPAVREASLPLLRTAGFSAPAALLVPGFVQVEVVPRWRTEPTAPLTHVIFPQWQRGVAVEAEVLTHAETAVRLQRSSFNLARWPLSGYALLQRALAGKRCYRLLIGQDLRTAVDTVNVLVRED